MRQSDQTDPDPTASDQIESVATSTLDAESDAIPGNPAAEAMADGSAETLKAQIYEALRSVYDPELGINIVDLGLIYAIDLREDGIVTITMTLTTPGCPMHESIGSGVGMALQPIAGVTGGNIHLVWEPRWDPSMMTDTGRAELGYW